jgi:hypothetical protein
MLLDRGFVRSPQQVDIAHSGTDRPLAHLSDKSLRLLVENAQQLKESNLTAIEKVVICKRKLTRAEKKNLVLARLTKKSRKK